MISFNTLIRRVSAYLHRYLACPYRRFVAHVTHSDEKHTKHAVDTNRMYFGTLVITGSYRGDGEVTFYFWD
jgi:hypothetical protein